MNDYQLHRDLADLAERHGLVLREVARKGSGGAWSARRYVCVLEAPRQ